MLTPDLRRRLPAYWQVAIDGAVDAGDKDAAAVLLAFALAPMDQRAAGVLGVGDRDCPQIIVGVQHEVFPLLCRGAGVLRYALAFESD